MSIYKSLSEFLLIDEKDLVDYINRAPHRYKVYDIPKRNGSGTRTIAQPAKELKVLQKVTLGLPLLSLPVHKNAYAYVNGIGIKQNAQKHSKNQYLLKMDFSDFFPSIIATDLIAHVEKHHGALGTQDTQCLQKLFFWRKKGSSEHRLSIGAPSSPFISNTVLYEFDSKLSEVCEQISVTYTRYADDLTFTTNISGVLSKLPSIVENILEVIHYPTLKINSAKTVFSSKKSNRHVTGLVLTNDDRVSLGRERKRYIRSLIYKYSKGELSDDEILRLKGFVGFSKHIEMSFYISLVKKYTIKVITNIEQFQTIAKK